MSIEPLRASLACTLAVLLAGCATTDEKYFSKTKTDANVFVSGEGSDIEMVAIMPFKAPTELIGTSVSDLFVTEMLRAGRYQLVERSQMSSVLSESELALSGLSDAEAIEVGAMLGAQGVILGTVQEYGTVAHRGHPYPVVAVSARMIDCDTGQVVWSVDHAKRAREKTATLSGHARVVVHEMSSALYKAWRRRQ